MDDALRVVVEMSETMLSSPWRQRLFVSSAAARPEPVAGS
jgi:hypothetical protein